MSKRIDRIDYFMNIAKLVSLRSTCPRAAVGCVVVADNQIVGTGYNGSPAGVEHCDEVGCDVVENHCRKAIHAEANAVIRLQNSPKSLAAYGPVAYCTNEPCWECTKLLYTVGVRDVWYKVSYLSLEYIELRNKLFSNLEIRVWPKAFLID